MPIAHLYGGPEDGKIVEVPDLYPEIRIAILSVRATKPDDSVTPVLTKTGIYELQHEMSDETDEGHEIYNWQGERE